MTQHLAFSGHQISIASQRCDHCGVTPYQLMQHGERPCARGLWPLDVAVSPRLMRGRATAPSPREDAGELCLRFDQRYGTCMGRLELRHRTDEGYDSCYCWRIQAPCGFCLSEVPECPKCGWRAEEPN